MRARKIPERRTEPRSLTRARVYRDRFDWIAPFLAKGAILDVGCIDERHPERIAQSLHARIRAINSNLVGFDADARAVEEAGRRGFEVRLGDAQDDPLGGPFDAIFAGELIEHLDNPGLFLGNAARSLRPGGILLLTTPNPFYANQFAKVLKHGRPQVHEAHRSWFSPDTLGVLLEKHSYEPFDFVWFGPPRGVLRRALARVRPYWNPSFGIASRLQGQN